MADSNPYSAPKKAPNKADRPDPTSGKSKQTKRTGPALYVGFCAMLGGFAAAQFLMRQNSLGFIFPMLGSVAGALIYRKRSKNWPVASAARARVSVYWNTAIVLAITIAVIMTRETKTQANAIVAVCLFVVLSFVVGMALSGARRYRNWEAETSSETAA